MDIYSNEGKKEIIKKFTPKTKVLKNALFAFIFGGTISLGAELLRVLYITLGASEKDALTLVGVTLILLASLLTALGLFDRIARYAGAGTLVPITGFSNSVTSQALDAKSEGFILGLGAKIFTIAGPVILYGITSGVLYGIIYFIYLYIIM
jgi:stage V sporulation protein AC